MEDLKMEIAYHSAPGYASCIDTVAGEIVPYGQ